MRIGEGGGGLNREGGLIWEGELNRGFTVYNNSMVATILRSGVPYSGKAWQGKRILFPIPFKTKRKQEPPDRRLGCHSQRFLKFPDFSLTYVKFPWPTELTISQIILILIMTQPFPQTTFPSSHLFMLSASHERCIWIWYCASLI